ncbi:Protein GLUTAMINE DUMPER 5 [Trifolium repens]|nr:protein GLUTAMINE DUMPER [Trifolium repens]WJX09708.1 Protein GLUTAMINE DUMPER 5 [Trifolium repens]
MRSIPTTMLNTHPNNTNTTITHSIWQTPIPYLFGGLAAIMGLIALALLALACSYCKLSRNNQDGDHDDLDNKESDPQTKEPIKAYEEKILVIMAGNENPTFLATPVVLSIIDKEIDNLVLVPTTSTPQESEGSCSSQHRL